MIYRGNVFKEIALCDADAGLLFQSILLFSPIPLEKGEQEDIKRLHLMCCVGVVAYNVDVMLLCITEERKRAVGGVPIHNKEPR